MPSEIRNRSLKRCRSRFALAAALVTLFAATPAQAARKTQEGTVSGTVTAHDDGAALVDVAVTLTGPEETFEATTDRKGKFKIKVPAGDYLIGLAKEGYAGFEVELSVEPGGRPVVTIGMLDEAAGRRSEAARHYNAGVAALRAGDRSAAKQSLIAAGEADPTLTEHHRLLAGIYLDENAWADAARSAEAALEAKPEDENALRMAYDAYRKLGDPKVVEVRRSLAADPGLRKTLAGHAFNEGAVADQKGDTELATRRFREALELDAGLAPAHFALASHDFRATRFDEALAAARRGLEADPASAQGRRLVYISLDAKGEQEAAAEALDAYAEVDVEGAVEILYQQGEADHRNGDLESAKRNLAKVLEYRPEHAQAHRVLGLTYASSDPERAKRHLRRFLELAPDDPEAPTAREILAAL